MKTIYFIGDSLSADYNIESMSQVGYGEVLRKYKAEDVYFINLAKQGRFDIVERAITKADLLIVQFSNNDQKISDPNRYTNKDDDFLTNLDYFYKCAVSRKAYCIFVTSPARKIFTNGKLEDTHLGYPEAMFNHCLRNGYLCVDLNSITKELYNKLGDENTKKYHLIYDAGVYERFKDGIFDNSHFNIKGANLISSLILNDLKNKFSNYYEYFIDYKKEINYVTK